VSPSTLSVKLNKSSLDSWVGEANVGEIEILDLGYKGIVSLEPNTFRGYSKVRHLYLMGNKLTSLPDGAFSGLDSLEVLILSKNEIAKIGLKAFVGLKNMETLDLSENRIQNLNSKDLFIELLRLETIDVSRNKVMNVAGNVLTHLVNLNDFIITDNPIVSISPSLMVTLCDWGHLRCKVTY
jgi:Leucine-rich repeat (LRR) protein